MVSCLYQHDHNGDRVAGYLILKGAWHSGLLLASFFVHFRPCAVVVGEIMENFPVAGSSDFITTSDADFWTGNSTDMHCSGNYTKESCSIPLAEVLS